MKSELSLILITVKGTKIMELPINGSNVVKISIYTTFAIMFRYPPEFKDQAEFVRLDIPTCFEQPADVRFAYAKAEGHIQLYDIPISQELVIWLQGPHEGPFFMGEYPELFKHTYDLICLELNSAARRALEYVKFFLGRDEIADEPASVIAGFTWSLNREDFFDLPNILTGKMSHRTQNPLTYPIRVELQYGLNNNITPFVAMRHLYRAIQDPNPRFKWIDATIAAELAVKEALIRARPELSMLIVNLPSPPISKLYGAILLEYLGERSPLASKMKDGSEVRNKLVHQPTEVSVTLDQAQDYVNDVMQAIHHLYLLLYPDWVVAKNLQSLRRFWC